MLEQKVYAKTGGNFNPIPMGAYTVMIADVNMVTSFNKFKGVDQDKLNYMMIVLDDNKCEDGTSTRGRRLFKRVANSLHEKAELTKVVKAVLGRNLTKAESESFDVESLVGKQVKVLVSQDPSTDGSVIWNNISSMSYADKELEPVEYTPKVGVIEKTSQPLSGGNTDPDALIAEIEASEKK